MVIVILTVTESYNDSDCNINSYRVI